VRYRDELRRPVLPELLVVIGGGLVIGLLISVAILLIVFAVSAVVQTVLRVADLVLGRLRGRRA